MWLVGWQFKWCGTLLTELVEDQFFSAHLWTDFQACFNSPSCRAVSRCPNQPNNHEHCGLASPQNYIQDLKINTRGIGLDWIEFIIFANIDPLLTNQGREEGKGSTSQGKKTLKSEKVKPMSG